MLYVNPLTSDPVLRYQTAENMPQRESAALKEFEQVFLYQFLREMRKTAPKEGIFKGSQQQDFFEELLDDHLAGEMAESGQFGLARQISAQLAANETGKNSSLIRAVGGLPLESSRDALPLPSSYSAGIPVSKAASAFGFSQAATRSFKIE